MVGRGLLSLWGHLVGRLVSQSVGQLVAQSVAGPSVVRTFGGRCGSLNLGVVWSVGWSVSQSSGQSAVGFFGREFVQWSVVGRSIARSVVRSFSSEVVQQSVGEY